MSAIDDFVMPPRHSGRSTSSKRPSTRAPASDALSSSESRGRRAYGNPFLKCRILTIHEYADELVHGGPERWGENKRIEEFGTPTVPIPVPLEPRETEASHEKRFLGWLSSRRIDIERVNVADERRLRMEFARFKVRRYDNGSLVNGRLRGKRRRDQYEEEEDEGEEEASSDEYDEEEDEEVEEDDGGEANEVDDDMDWRSQVKRRRNDPSNVPGAELLLRKRIVSIEQYQAEEERDRGMKLTRTDVKRRYGTTVAPIPVPLFAGETIDEYEHAFLRSLMVDPVIFEGRPNAERSARIKFARSRLTDYFAASYDSMNRISETDEDSERRVIVDIKPGPAQDAREIITSLRTKTDTKKEEPVVIKAEPIAEPTLMSQGPVTSSAAESRRVPIVCSLRVPEKGSSAADMLRAFISCGCQDCLLKCTSRIVDRIEALEQAPVRSVPPAATELPKDSKAKGIDVSKMVQITSLMKSRRNPQAAAGRTLETASREDPIELQLQTQYGEINSRVGLHELAVANLAAQLQETPVDRIEEASPTQKAAQDLEAVIEDEMDHRNAALAMLAVYMWRNERDELAQRISSPQASNVPHVQRVCHSKVRNIATALSQKRTLVATLKKQLEDVLTGESAETEHEASRLGKLESIGQELTRTEHETASLHAARRREIATLLHFDAHVRELVETLLIES